MGQPELYFRQLLSGRDFAVADPLARQMVNFAYAIGDRSTGEALLVDPAYAVGELLDALAADDMRCVGVLATHYHPDHVGGEMAGWSIEGSRPCSSWPRCRFTSNATSAWVERATGVDSSHFIAHHSGDIVTWERRGRAGPHPGAHAGQPVLPRPGSSHFGRHLVSRRLRPHGPARQ